MPRKGPPPKPTAIKRLEGFPGHHPRNEREPVAPVHKPSCPRHLKGEARREYLRTAKVLVTMRVLTDADRGTLAMLATSWGRYVEAENMISKGSLVIKTQAGNFIQNPFLPVSNRAMEIYLRCAAELGLTPASRTRLVASEPMEEQSLAEMLFGDAVEQAVMRAPEVRVDVMDDLD